MISLSSETETNDPASIASDPNDTVTIDLADGMERTRQTYQLRLGRLPANRSA
jgi:hypothetical protein